MPVYKLCEFLILGKKPYERSELWIAMSKLTPTRGEP